MRRSSRGVLRDEPALLDARRELVEPLRQPRDRARRPTAPACANACTTLPPSSRISCAAYGSTASQMLNAGSSELHMPEVSDIARMMSRKFSGSWNGSERTTSPNSIAKLAELARIDLLQLGEAHAAEAGEQLRSSPARARRCRPTAAARRPRGCRRPCPCRRATAAAMRTLPQPAAQAVGHLAHHPEVDEGEAASAGAPDAAPAGIRSARDRRDEDVARVRVGVEEAVA